MNTLKISFILLFISLQLNLYCQENWTLYENTKNNFEIEFSQKAIYSEEVLINNKKSFKKFNWKINISDLNLPNCHYSVNILKYSDLHINCKDRITDIINNSQIHITSSEKYKLLSSCFIEQQSFPGKVFRWKNKQNGNIKESRSFYIKGDVYSINVESYKNRDLNSLSKKFFESFNLINIPRGDFALAAIQDNRSYCIAFPNKPQFISKIIDSQYGKLILQIQSLETIPPNKNMAYMAMETQYPETNFNSENKYELNTFYQETINRSIETVGGNIVSISDIYYRNKLGKEYKYYIAEGSAFMVSRLFYINNKLYSYGVITTHNFRENNKLNRFLNSFKQIIE